MGDYDIKISCYFNDTLAGIFSGTAFFNGCAIFSGQVKDESVGLVGKLRGLIEVNNDQIMFNFLKSDDESPVIEFQVAKKRDNQEFLGIYRGAWRYRPGVVNPSFRYEDHLWSRRNMQGGLWISEPIIKEKQALIELLPPTLITEQTYSPEISHETCSEQNSEPNPEKDLKTGPAS